MSFLVEVVEDSGGGVYTKVASAEFGLWYEADSFGDHFKNAGYEVSFFTDMKNGEESDSWHRLTSAEVSANCFSDED